MRSGPSEVRIGLGGPFGLVGRLRRRNRRRPCRGHRALHQGQHRPPPGRSKIRHIRTCIRFFGPASQGRLGARAFLCRRGGGRSGEEPRAGWPVVSAVPQPWPWWAETLRAARLATDARGALCGQPVGQGRLPPYMQDMRGPLSRKGGGPCAARGPLEIGGEKGRRRAEESSHPSGPEKRLNNYSSQFVSILCRRGSTLAPTLQARV